MDFLKYYSIPTKELNYTKRLFYVLSIYRLYQSCINVNYKNLPGTRVLVPPFSAYIIPPSTTRLGILIYLLFDSKFN